MNVLTRLNQAPSPLLRMIVGALLLVLTGAGGYAVASAKTVTLDVDGTERRVAHPEIRKAVVQVELRKDVDLGDAGTDDDDEE